MPTYCFWQETSDANGVQTGGTEDMGETSRGGMDQEKGIERQVY